jgi:SAM-dependent methyltransferase
MYQLLARHLDDNSGILVAVPTDAPHADSDFAPNYHTLRGFEQYCDDLGKSELPALEFDGRECWSFLISADSLAKLDLPDDLFQLPNALPTAKVAIVPQAFVHPFDNYYGENRSDLLPFVPKGIQSLLDIGCSQGRFGAAVKETRNCRVTGIEINNHEAEVANKKLDEVWVGDALAMQVTEQFDCISCLDVIEHTANPRQLLLTIKDWLTSDGSILLNVPNVGFWAVVEDLLAGRWDYVPSGVLCETHLRFFTQHSLENLLKSAGLTPIRVEKQHIPIPEHVKVGFENYQKAGLAVDQDNLSTIAFTVLAKCTE